MTRLQGTPDETSPSVPMSGHGELVLGRLRERRQELGQHNGRALEVSAVSLAAMHDAAYGHVPAIRSDRQVRYREMQLAGERAMPLEDLAAIGLEGPVGARVAFEGLRILAGALGYLLVPVDAPSAEIHEAAAAVVEDLGPVVAGVTRAMADDGKVDDLEAADISPKVQVLKGRIATLESALSRRRA